MFVLRLETSSSVLEVGFATQAQAEEWLKDIRELAAKDEPFELVSLSLALFSNSALPT